MRLSIHHTTRYTYSTPVMLGPQTLRLKPATNANQRLMSFSLAVSPEPAGRTEMMDIEGNEATAVWFDSEVSELEIRSEATVETLRSNPFDYLWQGRNTLPASYTPAIEPALAPYRQHETDDAVVELAKELASRANGPQDFLTLLTGDLYGRIGAEVRESGDPRTPAETLRIGTGSCRDLAVLLMAVVRQQGFAARFVTGYTSVEAADADHELHAWAEVYVPGGGWRGFDPSTGLAVADRHVFVAAGARAIDAATVTGSYRGRATSRLEAQVQVSEVGGV